MDPSTDAAGMRQQHDALQKQLATRASTGHFAHAGVSAVATIIFAGTAARLWWKGDAEQVLLSYFAGAAALALLVYTLVRVVLGWRRLEGELVGFAQLKRLRRALGLDDPSSLIPR